MVLLIGFAFLAGAGTALSPCVPPVLPVVLSAGFERHVLTLLPAAGVTGYAFTFG